jgi:hypothetical protein
MKLAWFTRVLFNSLVLVLKELFTSVDSVYRKLFFFNFYPTQKERRCKRHCCLFGFYLCLKNIIFAPRGIVLGCQFKEGTPMWN